MSQPLIKPICGDKAPALFEGSPEGGFRGYCFHPGIDHPGTDGDILGPKRHQPPVAFLDVSFVLVDHNDGYFLGGSHVVVGLELEGGRVSIKVALKFT
jgi:hypothetical protein